MEIMREDQSGRHRSWRVRVGETEYKVDWNAESQSTVTRPQWDVRVLVKRQRGVHDRSHWRSIRGQWIIKEIRAFEGA